MLVDPALYRRMRCVHFPERIRQVESALVAAGEADIIGRDKFEQRVPVVQSVFDRALAVGRDHALALLAVLPLPLWPFVSARLNRQPLSVSLQESTCRICLPTASTTFGTTAFPNCL